MPKNYIDFELTFQPTNNSSVFFQVDSGTGGEVAGWLPQSFPDQDTTALIERIQQDDTDEDMLVELGKKLYEALFLSPEVRRLFAFTQGSQGEDTGIRLKFRTAPGDTVVGVIPWEFLYDPNRDNPFVLLDISVVRYPQAPVRVPNLEAKLPLRVLLTSAQPSDMSATEADREIDAVAAALQDRGLATDGRIEIVEERHLTRVKFQRLIRQGFHVWHFAGHGGFSRDGRSGVVFFEDAAGSRDAVSARELGILMGSSGVRLILLDACESGTLALEPFRSIAPALTASGTPAVVAMQFSVPEETTTAFASEFYAALAEGLPVDACVTEGRKAVMAVAGLRRPDWGIPVVYTRAQDGRLFQLPQQPTTDDRRSTTGGVSVNAPNANIQGGINITTGNTNISGNTFNSGNAVTSNSGLSEEDRTNLEADLAGLKRRYWKLKQQSAIYGISTPPEISIQLEDTEKAIRQREKQLGLPPSIL